MLAECLNGIPLKQHIDKCMYNCRQGFGLEIGCLYTRLVTALNYSAITNFHTLQITRAHTKCFPVRSVFTSSCSGNGF
jgi:hypothetical protein